jgi:hypothetical protein
MIKMSSLEEGIDVMTREKVNVSIRYDSGFIQTDLFAKTIQIYIWLTFPSISILSILQLVTSYTTMF